MLKYIILTNKKFILSGICLSHKNIRPILNGCITGMLRKEKEVIMYLDKIFIAEFMQIVHNCHPFPQSTCCSICELRM
jgi:hypothetical protein